MKKNVIVFLLAAVSAALFSSCTFDEKLSNQTELIKVNGREVPAAVFEQGMVRLYLTEELSEKLTLETSADGKLTANVKSVNNAIESLNIVKMERTFPYAGKFEARTRAEGMHLWYNVYFDENAGLVRAGEILTKVEGVKELEYRPKMIHYKSEIVPGTIRTSEELKEMAAAAPSNTDYFDDPGLWKQWHYYNDGSFNGSVAGSDINVLPAWQKGYVGSEDVVVAVIDAGIDYTHEDLADNMWVNPVAANPESSHGYNFCNNSYNIKFGEHGTHVGGTISAVNNNGIGVAGVAGGNYAEGIKGVKLMSCQIFRGDDEDQKLSQGSGAQAMHWAANNGAVISQNSWGYDQEFVKETPKSDKDAIDYFVKYAGMDENGVQVGPMAGGIVIFAAGNESMDVCCPPSYESCFAVSSIAADFRPAYYTNFGSWCDIIAPGGDTPKRQDIYSTIPGNRYAEFQGTSMACPHVSGVAALIISHYGGIGFTPEKLRKLMEDTSRDITDYTGTDKHYGVGLIDATKALSMGSTVPPEPVTEYEFSARSNFIDCSFEIPTDPDDGTPSFAYVYYSKEEFDPAAELPESVMSVEVPVRGAVGDKVVETLSDLEFNTTYYLSIATRDLAHNYSTLSPVVSVVTGDNHNPEIAAVGGTEITLASHETGEVEFRVSDPDGHAVTTTLDENYEGIRLNLVDEGRVKVSISALGYEAGSYTISFTATDAYGLTASQSMEFHVLENTAPKLVKEIEDVVFVSTIVKAADLNLTEYFNDPDGETLSYKVTVTDLSGNGESNAVKAEITAQQLKVTPKEVGNAVVTVVASDASGEQVSTAFNVLVRGSEEMLEFYPNPVVDILNVRSASDVNTVVKVYTSNGTEVYSQEGTASPFAPMQVDLSSLPGGNYMVKAVVNGEEVEKNIVKL